VKRGGPLRRTPFKRRYRPSIPSAVREQVRRRSRGLCEFGGCPTRAAHMHHRLPRSAGGPHTVDNLADLCGSHHRWVHAHPRESYELGLLVRRGG
jgi:5-methylcytosine-specific restriction endonuclease McrA